MSPIRDLPGIAGLHHVKLPVSDLDRSLRFYERMFGAERIPEADHRRGDDGKLYGYIMTIPGLKTMLKLRLNPAQAIAQRQFDPFTFAVKDRTTLEQWCSHLDAEGIRHSPILTAIQAWVMVVEDPDGHRLRLYTLETHDRDIKPDEANPWLQG